MYHKSLKATDKYTLAIDNIRSGLNMIKNGQRTENVFEKLISEKNPYFLEDIELLNELADKLIEDDIVILEAETTNLLRRGIRITNGSGDYCDISLNEGGLVNSVTKNTVTTNSGWSIAEQDAKKHLRRHRQ